MTGMKGGVGENPFERDDLVDEQHRDDGDDLAGAVRAYLEENDLPPKTAHGRDAVVDVFRALREHGTLATSELQEQVYEGYTDKWAGARGVWNALDRYLKDVPGTRTPATDSGATGRRGSGGAGRGRHDE